MKIRYFSRLYIFYLSLFFVIISGISFLTIDHLEQKFKNYVRDSLQSVLLTIEKASQVFIEERKSYIRALAQTENIIASTRQLVEARANENRDAELDALNKLRSFFRPLLQNENAIGFYIVDRERINIASMRDQNINKTNIIEKNYPDLIKLAFLGETVITPPLTSDVKLKNQYGVLVENSLTMFLITPIIERNGQVNHVLTIRVDPRFHLSKITELGRIGRTGETYAFNQNAQMITESRFSEQLRKTHLQPLYGNDYIKITDPGINLLEASVSSVDLSRDKPLTLMAQSATQGHNGMNLEGYRDYRGQDVLGAWLWLPSIKLGFATEIDVDEALEPFYSTVKAFSLVIVLTIALCLAMLTVIWQMRRKWQEHTLRLNKLLEKKVKLRTAHLEKTKADLNQAMVDLKETAATDALTGLANRRHFDYTFEREWKQCIRDKKALAILLFDVDHFKAYNDNYGHLAGDDCLIEVSEFLQTADIARRPGDIVARYGGEEFIVLLSDATMDYVKEVASSIRDGINQLAIPHYHRPDKVGHVTVSVGVSFSQSLYRIYPNLMIDNADKALYQAKKAGRNRIAFYEEDDLAMKSESKVRIK